MAIVLALLAGFSYAGAAVLQQRVAAEQAPELSLRPALLLALVRRPLWLLGIALDIGAYLFEAAALATGTVVTVAPLLVSGLLFALPLSTVGGAGRVTRREWIPAIAVTGGLAVFVIVGSPEGNRSTASLGAWIAAGTFVAVAAGSLVVCARGALGGRRALLLGLATGTIYGFTAVLTKATVDLFGNGVLQVLGHWQLYALLSVSAVGLLLNQSAFQAGHVAASLPAISVTNPVLSSIFAVTMFGEHLDAAGVPAVSVTIAAIAAMAVGTIALARSPLVTHEPAVVATPS
ncbi:MAG TPA: DMT family transporter [Acidimicrobiia bacterium]|nr:DMT family transporter [Acidimicrobiia bacterium]